MGNRLIDTVNKKLIFITWADKGGAILIMNHNLDVASTIENEVSDATKQDEILSSLKAQHNKVTILVKN